MALFSRRLLAAKLLIASAVPAFAQSSDPLSPDIVVTATRSPLAIQQAGSAISVITREEIEKTASRDLDDLLRRVPGLTLTQNGGPGQTQTVRIRGGESRHTLVLIDGIRVNDPASTGREFDFSSLVLTDVERIEVLRGPQSALYGSDAMGGVINILTRKGGGAAQAHLSAEAGRYGTKEIKGGVSGSSGPVTYALSLTAFDNAGFSAYGGRVKRIERTRFWPLEADGAQRLGLSSRFGVELSDSTRIEFGVSSNDNRAQYDAAFGDFPDTPSKATSRLNNVYARLINDALGGQLRNTFTLFGNRTDRDIRSVSYFGPVNAPFGFRNDSRYLGDRAGFEYQGDLKLGSYGLLIFGAKIEGERANLTSQDVFPVPSARQQDVKAEQATRSVFALHQITLADRLHLSLGGRIDDVEKVDTFATWRATIAYELPQTDTTFRASAGTGGKAPSLYQQFSPLYGSSFLEPEHSVGIDAGVDQRLLEGRLKLSGTLFFNRYRNLIDFGGSPRCRMDQIFGCYFNVSRAETSGFEASADLEIVPDRLHIKAAYTFLNAENVLTHERLVRRPENEGRLGFIITPTRKLTLEPSIVFVGDRLDAAFPVNVKLQPYARLDMQADYKVTEQVSVFARAENLTNAHYEEVLNYGTSGRAFYGGVRARW